MLGCRLSRRRKSFTAEVAEGTEKEREFGLRQARLMRFSREEREARKPGLRQAQSVGAGLGRSGLRPYMRGFAIE
jgi:hypothetical protein